MCHAKQESPLVTPLQSPFKKLRFKPELSSYVSEAGQDRTGGCRQTAGGLKGRKYTRYQSTVKNRHRLPLGLAACVHGKQFIPPSSARLEVKEFSEFLLLLSFFRRFLN